MSKYKKLMLEKGIMQKEVLDHVRRTDPRIDKPLLSKIVNDICLPTKPALDSICMALSCKVLDIYDAREIDLMPHECTEQPSAALQRESINIKTEETRKRREKNDFYNLTVEIPRKLAERVFSDDALRKLGYLSKTDFVRRAVESLAKRLDSIEEKEKTATSSGR